MKKIRASPSLFNLPLLKGQVTASHGIPESSIVVSGVPSLVMMFLGFIQRLAYDHTGMD